MGEHRNWHSARDAPGPYADLLWPSDVAVLRLAAAYVWDDLFAVRQGVGAGELEAVVTRVLGARPGPAEYEYRCDGEKCAAQVRGVWPGPDGWTYNAKLHLDFCPDCTVKLAAERGEQERLF